MAGKAGGSRTKLRQRRQDRRRAGVGMLCAKEAIQLEDSCFLKAHQDVSCPH